MLSKEKLDELNTFLAAGYDRSKWLDVLGDLFHLDNIDQFAPPRSIPTNDIAAKFEQIGEIKGVQIGNADDMEFAVFEIQINHQTQLHRNRTQLRNLVARHMGPYQGALAVYHHPTKPDGDKKQWRFSFISKEQSMAADGTISEHETPPKRFTYLLGEGAQIRTAFNRFAELAKARTAKGVPLEALKAAFAVETLNREFYERLFDWYEAAKGQTEFPNDEKAQDHISIALIRLLTRLLFVWFIKEKDLVSADFFDKEKVQELIDWEKPSSYYKAILQNLFFATLNREIKERSFSNQTKDDYLVTNVYRYKDYFNNANKQDIIALFSQTPFLNGGLFECLDRKATLAEQSEYDKDKKLRKERTAIRVDSFSDHRDNKIKLPNKLFFSDNGEKGLIDILSQYQFTLEENTTSDNDIALDPELLGKVFENLLASYNPETKQVARQASGSYYTPREIVAYMVDESLKDYLSQILTATQDITKNPKPSLIKLKKEQGRLAVPVCAPEQAEERLNALFTVHGDNKFNKKQTNLLIKAIDKIKILDPAVGSGAFAMGALNRLVELLAVLDPENQQWKKRQLSGLNDPESIAAVEEIFSAENQHNNYGRKLYLIEKAIFGVDIQPIAIQICKLRFFISLVIEQTPEENASKNHHIKPLPNLEIKFVAADSLIRLDKPANTKQHELMHPNTARIKRDLEIIRSKRFATKSSRRKQLLSDKDEELRLKLQAELENNNWREDIAKLIADWNPYNQSSTANWFDAEQMFGIYDDFDIVIGNPPYINIERLRPKVKENLLNNYTTCERRTDIYIGFLEHALSLLSAKGTINFIIPHSFTTQKYGEKIRRMITDEYTVHEIVDASTYRIFENATVYNVVIRIGKKDNRKTIIRHYTNNDEFKSRQGKSFFVKQIQFKELQICRFETRQIVFASLPIKQKIWEKSRYLKDICLVAYGARLNHRSGKPGKEHYISKESIPHGKKFTEGRNIDRYCFDSAGWLNYCPDEHYNPMFRSLFESHKIMFINIVSNKLRFSYDTDGYYNSHTVINCVRLDMLQNEKHTTAVRAIKKSSIKFAKQFDYKFLLGILNSRLMNWYFLLFLSEQLHCYPNDAKNMPIFVASPEEQAPIIKLVDKILAAKKKDATTDTSAYEAKIDNLVYSLYDLTPAEITIIETPTNTQNLYNTDQILPTNTPMIKERKTIYICSTKEFNIWLDEHCKEGMVYRGSKDSAYKSDNLETANIDIKNVDVHVARGLAKWEKDNFDGAIADFDKAIQVNPQHEDTYYFRGFTKGKQGDYDGAIADFDKVIEINPQHENIYCFRGFAKSLKNDYDGAIADFDKAIQINPQLEDAYYLRGLVKGERSDYDGAIVDFDKAIQINPQHEKAYYQRGLVKGEKGDYDRAITDFDKVIQINPQHENVHYFRGIAKSQKGDNNGTIVDLDKAIQINPQHEDAYCHRGLAKSEKGDYDGAIADFDKVIQINPQHEDTYYRRGLAKGEKDDYDGAITDFDKVIQINPQHEDVHYFRGIAKSLKGDYDGAIADFDMAIEINPQYAMAYYRRGTIQYQLENYEEAEKNYRKAIEISPDNPDIAPYGTN